MNNLIKKQMKDNKEKTFKSYPHEAPEGKFIGEYLQPPPTDTAIKNPEKYNPYAREDISASSAVRWYSIGPKLVYVHQLGQVKMLRDTFEKPTFVIGDIIIPQGNADVHVWENSLYLTLRFDSAIAIIKKGTEDHKKILKFNNIDL